MKWGSDKILRERKSELKASGAFGKVGKVSIGNWDVQEEVGCQETIIAFSSSFLKYGDADSAMFNTKPLNHHRESRDEGFSSANANLPLLISWLLRIPINICF
jgi:hypothetical protein